MITRRSLLSQAVLVPALLGCEDPQQRSIREKLVGTWTEEYSEEHGPVIGTVVLYPDGKFEETVLSRAGQKNAGQGGGRSAGEWSFDGMNLKRKYTSMDGQPLLNASFRYVTYAVKDLRDDGFVGVDNVAGKEAKFRRKP